MDEMQLYEWNEYAYKKLIESYENANNRAAVVYPPGTGKTSIALKYTHEHKDHKVLYIAPYNMILHQLKTSIFEDFNKTMKDFKNLNRMTYAGLNQVMKTIPEKLAGYDFIVFDEFHHTGSNEWGKSVEKLLELNKNANILGLSATKERYFENRDMAEEIFEGNIVAEMSIQEAMLRGILPCSDYYMAQYSFNEDIEDLQEYIDECKDPEKKKEAQNILNEAKKKFYDKTEDISNILGKGVKNKNGKYLVFCSSKKDLEIIKKYIPEWFSKVNTDIEISEIHSDKTIKENENTMKKFKEENEKLQVLLSIDMLNEGVHVKKLNGILMTRRTGSPRIFYQEFGRVLAANRNTNHIPEVYDLVANISAIEAIESFSRKYKEDYERLVKNAKNKEEKEKLEEKNEEIQKFIKISEKVKEFKDIVDKITELTNSRSTWIETFKEWKEWTIENGITPSNSSKEYVYEKRLANRMNVVTRKIQNKIEEDRTEEEKYIINEYENLYNEYGRKKDYKTNRETFEEWKKLTLKNEITPSNYMSGDDYEYNLAKRVNSIICKIKKKSEEIRTEEEKYIIDEYKNFCNQYGRKKDYKTNIEGFQEWKEWTIQNGVTPNNSNKENKNEKKIANKMGSMIKKIKDKSEEEQTQEEKYIISEYEILYNQYGINKDDKTSIEGFEEWKKWTIQNETTPSNYKSTNDYEYKLANKIKNTIRNIKSKQEDDRNEEEKYIIDEYENLYSQYGRKKEYKSAIETFEEWKRLTTEKEITPTSSNTENEYEKKLAQRLNTLISTIRNKPEEERNEEEKYIIDEYETLYNKYGRKKDYKTNTETFEEWKKWTIESEITPSYFARENEYEKSLAKKINSVTSKIKKKSEAKQTEEEQRIIQEYEKITNKYGRNKNFKTNIEGFEEWKKWTIKNEVTPNNSAKEDKNEKRIATKMSNVIQNIRKKIGEERTEEENHILEQYEELQLEYGRKLKKKDIENLTSEVSKNDIKNALLNLSKSADEMIEEINKKNNNKMDR